MASSTIVEETFGSVEQLQKTLEPSDLLDKHGNILLSSGELLNIQTYVKQGLSLPIKEADLNTQMGVEEGAVYEEFQSLKNQMLLAYKGVHDNCQFWDDAVSKEINKLAKDIVDYATRSVEAYNEMQLLSDQLGDQPPEGQDAIQMHFLKSINALHGEAEQRKEFAASLLEKLTAFRLKMGENQKNLSGVKDQARKEYNTLEQKTKGLSKEINELRDEIDTNNKEHNKQVAIAASHSAAAVTFGFILAIPFSIAAGIASDKAFKLKGKINNAKKKIEANTETMQRDLALMALYNNAGNNVDDFAKDLEGGVVPLVEKIEQIWQRMSSRLESITKALDQSKNKADALLRAVNFKEASDKWMLVKAKAEHWLTVRKVEFTEVAAE